MRIETRADAIRIAQLDAFVNFQPDITPIMTLHREVPGDHEESADCWCLPMVISLLDPRLLELAESFDCGQ